MNAMLSVESAIWLLLSAVLLGLIPTAVAYSRCLTDNYIYGKPHFDLVDFATWWVIGVFLFPAAMTLSIINKSAMEKPTPALASGYGGSRAARAFTSSPPSAQARQGGAGPSSGTAEAIRTHRPMAELSPGLPT
jgi:hypothetical protein